METIINRINTAVTGQTNNLIAIALKNAIEGNQDGNIILSNIKDMANDNYVMMRDVLGKNLLTDILNYKL